MNTPELIKEAVAKLTESTKREIESVHERLMAEQPEWYMREMRIRLNTNILRSNFHDD